ncbi:MAG: nickel-dependent lactate racemase [Bacteroidota bacterium]|nr:nickel-dependent lactate racemase [Bacteroidota bacterium]
MLVKIPYGNSYIDVQAPGDSIVYRTSYKVPEVNAGNLVLRVVRNPIGCKSLSAEIKKSGAKSVVLVVSDITRPIPYAGFLNALLKEIESAGVSGNKIIILIATGMHRPSTDAEQESMFGTEVCKRYRIIDHKAERGDELVTVNGRSWAGHPIELNRYFVEAEFRIVTGLVEPHFMAGFSGGRKSVCPGLCSLETVKMFHGYSFLDNSSARNGNLKGNPLHNEALSIARQAKVDFCINLLVNNEHRLVDAVAGELEASHEMACSIAGKYACPSVQKECDVVLTSSGGYPLDSTFYQCVKGMVSCLPAVKKEGIIISVGSCYEGIGSTEYQSIMHKYSGRWQEFLKDIKKSDKVVKDQWQFQMQTRTLDHVGADNLYFVTNGLTASELDHLCVNGIHVHEDKIQEKVQELLDRSVQEGRSLAIIPEGPYCAPV